MPHRHHRHRLDPDVVRSTVIGVVAIAAVYTYFLIFAEFAFLENARRVLSERYLGLLMALLGTGGIIGSLAAARRFNPVEGPRLLAAGFVGCVIAAALALVAINIF